MDLSWHCRNAFMLISIPSTSPEFNGHRSSFRVGLPQIDAKAGAVQVGKLRHLTAHNSRIAGIAFEPYLVLAPFWETAAEPQTGGGGGVQPLHHGPPVQSGRVRVWPPQCAPAETGCQTVPGQMSLTSLLELTVGALLRRRLVLGTKKSYYNWIT